VLFAAREGHRPRGPGRRAVGIDPDPVSLDPAGGGLDDDAMIVAHLPSRQPGEGAHGGGAGRRAREAHTPLLASDPRGQARAGDGVIITDTTGVGQSSGRPGCCLRPKRASGRRRPPSASSPTAVMAAFGPPALRHRAETEGGWPATSRTRERPASAADGRPCGPTGGLGVIGVWTAGWSARSSAAPGGELGYDLRGTTGGGYATERRRRPGRRPRARLGIGRQVTLIGRQSPQRECASAGGGADRDAAAGELVRGASLRVYELRTDAAAPPCHVSRRRWR
jgi:hypothetical protein